MPTVNELERYNDPDNSELIKREANKEEIEKLKEKLRFLESKMNKIYSEEQKNYTVDNIDEKLRIIKQMKKLTKGE